MRRCSPSNFIRQSRSEPVSDPRDIATGKSFKSLQRNFEPVKQAANFSFVAVGLALGRRVRQQLGVMQAAKDPLHLEGQHFLLQRGRERNAEHPGGGAERAATGWFVRISRTDTRMTPAGLGQREQS
jgi:hypothetical protein